MITESIHKFLGTDWSLVQEGIRTYLGTDISLLGSVNDSLLKNTGKQVRPLLSLLVARACAGKANSKSIRYAIASELLHNATLLHDDVADASDMRRGEPTVRAVLGPEASVLIGDFWLVRAVKAVLDADAADNGRVISIFSSTLSDLAEGEMLQLQKASSCDTNLQDYLGIIYRKTASLFVATTLSAAISVDADAATEKSASDFGRNLGLAFQIRDDILDYLPANDTGKAVGVDVIEHKITLPLLCAMDNVDEARQREIRSMVRDISEEKKDEIIGFVRENGGIEGAQKVLEEYGQAAMEALRQLPPSQERQWLEKIVVAFSDRMK